MRQPQYRRVVSALLPLLLLSLLWVPLAGARTAETRQLVAQLDVSQPDEDFDTGAGGGLLGGQVLATPGEDCIPSDTRMCLNNGRFRVEVTWSSQDGRTGKGHVVPYGSDDSGMFWFFVDTNWELLIKVLNGCSYNNRYWVFFAATTDQEFTITIVDTETGDEVAYTNPLKNPADAVTDTDAFATCP